MLSSFAIVLLFIGMLFDVVCYWGCVQVASWRPHILRSALLLDGGSQFQYPYAPRVAATWERESAVCAFSQPHMVEYGRLDGVNMYEIDFL